MPTDHFRMHARPRPRCYARPVATTLPSADMGVDGSTVLLGLALVSSVAIFLLTYLGWTPW